MKSIPPHRVALNHGLVAAIYLARGRADLAEMEIVKLTSWIVLQRGAERVSDLDCLTCGACCVGNLDDGCGFATVTVADRSRLSAYARRRLTVINVGPDQHYATPTMFTEEFGSSCAFLRGTPGRRASCGIYETRPDVCRKYKPGSKDCKSARRELGLLP